MEWAEYFSKDSYAVPKILVLLNRIVEYFLHSSKGQDELADANTRLNRLTPAARPPRRLILSTMTRWNSRLDCIEEFINQYEAIEKH